MARNKKIPTWKVFMSLKTGGLYTQPIAETNYQFMNGQWIQNPVHKQTFIEYAADYTFFAVCFIERITSSGVYVLNVSTGSTFLMRKVDFIDMLAKTTIYKNKIVGRFGLKKSNKPTIIYVGEE